MVPSRLRETLQVQLALTKHNLRFYPTTHAEGVTQKPVFVFAVAPSSTLVDTVTLRRLKTAKCQIWNILISKNQNEIPIISRERQLLKVQKCLNHLKSFNLKKNIDMAAEDIRSAIKETEEIYHKFDIEQILDIIFNDFCIGK